MISIFLHLAATYFIVAFMITVLCVALGWDPEEAIWFGVGWPFVLGFLLIVALPSLALMTAFWCVYRFARLFRRAEA